MPTVGCLNGCGPDASQVRAANLKGSNQIPFTVSIDPQEKDFTVYLDWLNPTAPPARWAPSPNTTVDLELAK